MTERHARRPRPSLKRIVAALGVALALGGCAGEDSGTFMPGSRLAVQPFPDNYKADVLAFMQTYLNDPKGVHDAAMAAPALRTITGRERYVVCLRYTATGQGDAQGGNGDRAVVFLDGRLERLIEKGQELCAGAAFAPFPEMEKMTRLSDPGQPPTGKKQ